MSFIDFNESVERYILLYSYLLYSYLMTFMNMIEFYVTPRFIN